MKSFSLCYLKLNEQLVNSEVNLVLCGFDRKSESPISYERIREKFPNGEIVMFSTSGHFVSKSIQDEHAVLTALNFEKGKIITKSFDVSDYKDSNEIGAAIVNSFDSALKGLCVISDGGEVNGDSLIGGINETLPAGIPVFGGMAGDGTRFEKTLVGLNSEPVSGKVVAIGFYGDSFRINGACNSGWSPVGVEFKITKSEGNKLFELNGSNAYDILYDFLKPESNDDFTKNTLYYPFLLNVDSDTEIIRTPIAVDHEAKTITYAGDMIEGKTVKLMKAGTMQLLDSTLQAAKSSQDGKHETNFVFAVSCVGRRVVLDDMANEEYFELKSVFGDKVNYFGFYSYGEFFRIGKNDTAMLHNQTFTMATISED